MQRGIEDSDGVWTTVVKSTMHTQSTFFTQASLLDPTKMSGANLCCSTAQCSVLAYDIFLTTGELESQ